MRLKGGFGAKQVEEELKETLASDKNEILWGRFGINYNHEEEIFRKGSVVFREVGGRENLFRHGGSFLLTDRAASMN